MRGAPWGGALARVVEFVVARLVNKLRAFGPQKKTTFFGVVLSVTNQSQ